PVDHVDDAIHVREEDAGEQVDAQRRRDGLDVDAGMVPDAAHDDDRSGERDRPADDRRAHRLAIERDRDRGEDRGERDEERHAAEAFGGTTGRRAAVTFLPEPEPRERWATIVSVDDHVVEPPDAFADRFPAKFRDAAPRVVTTDDGGEAWSWNGELLPNV